MTREEAIDIILNEVNTHTIREGIALNMAIKALEQEPTKEEKALLQKWRDNRGISMKDFEDAMEALEHELKWIPVSERLPENFQRVLVTLVNYNGDKVVRVAEYNVRQRIFRVLENHDLWEVGEKGLLAWQPLPKPYKAESEE